MQIARLLLALFVVIALVPANTIFAEKPRDGVVYSFGFYDDNANNRVLSPAISLSSKMTDRYYLGAKINVDAISSATKSSQASGSTQSSGEGDDNEGGMEQWHMRYSSTLSGTYDDDSNTLTGGGYYSTESDYTGRSVFATYLRRLNLNNTTIGAGLTRSFDHWDPGADNRQLPEDQRNERDLDLSITQLLSPRLSMQLVYSSLRTDGFIARPNESFVTNAFTLYARYPDTRNADAYAVRLVALLNEPTSFQVYYRRYRDDWRIRSDTMNLELYRDLSRTFVLGARYRYYNQAKAFFAKDLDTYTPADQLVAVDYRMYAFRTDTIGTMAIIKPWWGERRVLDPDKIKLKLSADYFITSKNRNIQYVYNKDRLSGVFATVALEYNF